MAEWYKIPIPSFLCNLAHLERWGVGGGGFCTGSKAMADTILNPAVSTQKSQSEGKQTRERMQRGWGSMERTRIKEACPPPATGCSTQAIQPPSQATGELQRIPDTGKHWPQVCGTFSNPLSLAEDAVSCSHRHPTWRPSNCNADYSSKERGKKFHQLLRNH